MRGAARPGAWSAPACCAQHARSNAACVTPTAATRSFRAFTPHALLAPRRAAAPSPPAAARRCRRAATAAPPRAAASDTPPPAPRGSRRAFDVAVLGGGMLAIAAARELARSGRRVLLADPATPGAADAGAPPLRALRTVRAPRKSARSRAGMHAEPFLCNAFAVARSS
jgi:hypothetical protein